MPQQLPLLHQQQQPPQPFMPEPYMPNDSNTSNMYASPRQPMYNNYPTYSSTQPQAQLQPPSNNINIYPQYPTYSATQPQTQLQPPSPPNNSSNKNLPDFHRFYGPVSLHIKTSPQKKFLFTSISLLIKPIILKKRKGQIHLFN